MKNSTFQGTLLLFITCLLMAVPAVADDAPLKVAPFTVDVTPPLGSPLAYNPMERAGNSLWLKGMVFVTDDQPVVVAAVDWIGIGGEGNTRFREVIARAVGTTPERVAVHVLHQHDAPRLDWGVEETVGRPGAFRKNLRCSLRTGRHAKDGRGGQGSCRACRSRYRTSGWEQAKVEKVASNRRILGPDGKVLHMRFTATADPEIRAFPDGTIDPYVKSISFYDGDELLCVLTYYATHPQSYYRTGAAGSDFPGMARILREDALGVPHIHFNGAGGNIGAGKYNDGAHDNRVRLAGRLAERHAAGV